MAPNGANQRFFIARQPFYILFKKRRVMTHITRIIRPESRGPQGAIGGLLIVVYVFRVSVKLWNRIILCFTLP